MPKRKLIYWSTFTAIEILIFWCYRWYQPRCEPCIPNWPCPPCISDEQVLLQIAGIGIALVFIGWQVVVLLKTKRV